MRSISSPMMEKAVRSWVLTFMFLRRLMAGGIGGFRCSGKELCGCSCACSVVRTSGAPDPVLFVLPFADQAVGVHHQRHRSIAHDRGPGILVLAAVEVTQGLQHRLVLA